MADHQLDRVAAERWFLHGGLPYVLRRGRLLRRIWSRSAPMLAGIAVISAVSAVNVMVTGKHAIDINGTPTRSEWFVLLTVVLVLPVAATVGWLVARMESARREGIVSGVSLVVMTICVALAGPSPRVLPDLVFGAVVVALVFLCTATGVGSILGWGFRVTLENLALAGSLFTRALPVLLLTFLVFFNSLVWLMAEHISRPRLWLALSFLYLIAVVFLVTSTLEHVRPILNSQVPPPANLSALAGTPLLDVPDGVETSPLTSQERVNIVAVLAISHIIQLLTVAVVSSSIFFGLGLIVIDPELLAAWTHNGSPSGQILGMTFPVPQALIQITLFLAAVTFMYLAALAVSDADYRSRFHDPLIEELKVALVARDRYRAATHKA